LGRRRQRALSTLIALFASLLVGWTLHSAIRVTGNPSMRGLDMPISAVTGLTPHDIRNIDYRSESDFTPAYYNRTSSRVGPFACHLAAISEAGAQEYVCDR
jgi:hypothetical protein